MIQERSIDEPGQWDEQGNPTKTVAQVIIDECKVGLPVEIAAQYAGITYRTFRRWLVDGRTILRRLSIEPDLELSEQEQRFAQFATDVGAAQAFWIHNANVTMERAMRTKRRTSTKVVYNMVKDQAGNLIQEEVERHVTTVDEPVELGPLQWRLAKLAPQVYGPMPRYEQETPAGESEQIDIKARVLELLARVGESLVIDTDTDTNGNGAG